MAGRDGLARELRSRRGGGRPLSRATRAFFESRLGHDFGGVRVHADARAVALSRDLDARAFTSGRDVFFGAGNYDPASRSGRRLLAHELVHVIQQRGGDRPAVQRQFITPHGQGGGYGGLIERSRRTAMAPYRVCARPLQIPGVGLIANHAYVEAPGNTYAVISPLCEPTDGGPDDPVFRTAVAKKWDNSPDPCGKTPSCVECRPKPGVSDVGQCLRAEFARYSDPSEYNAPVGPNSNTFAGTLARACCADMVPKPRALGIVPGWNHAPARPRQGDCADDPSC